MNNRDIEPLLFLFLSLCLFVVVVLWGGCFVCGVLCFVLFCLFVCLFVVIVLRGGCFVCGVLCFVLFCLFVY